MSVVMAAIDNSAAAKPVLVTASAIGRLLDVTVVALHARENGGATARAAADAAHVELEMACPPVATALAAAARRPEVTALVVGARGTPGGRRPAGHTALALATSLDKPLVVVPPLARLADRIRRILVPLDGTPASAAALSGTVRLACRGAVEVVLLHVHGEETLPAFEEQSEHELDAWSAEFLARSCADATGNIRVEVRAGVPGRRVVEAAGELAPDLIALGWSRNLAEGHGAVVREVLATSSVPVLLLPMP